jgi:hypothetical protein
MDYGVYLLFFNFNQWAGDCRIAPSKIHHDVSS